MHSPALPCANCGTPLAGPYCSRCGQHVADYHRSVWRFVVDFLDNTFSWDSRFLRTLVPLFRQPGFLTKEFMAGRRVHYVHPLRLFLFTSAVCLTLLHFGGNNVIAVNTKKHRKDKAASETATDQQKTSPSKANSNRGGGTDGDADGDEVFSSSPAPAPPAAVPPTTPAVPAASTPSTSNPAAAPVDPDDIHNLNDVIHQAIAGKLDDAKAERVGRKISDALEKKMTAPGGMERFSREFTEGIRHRLSYVALAMLPIFALMLRALYWREDTFYFQHLVFSLHYHSFMLLFWTAYSWLSTILKVSFLHSMATLLLLAVPAYLFLALRQVYGEGVRRTWVKVILLGGLHLLAIVSALATIGALSFFSAM